jgi:A/G-specific adenine glycosylase
VADKEILPLVEQTLDRSDPRRWYYALMDYGTTLKKEVGNANRQSRHYRKQPPFHNSDRKIRGAIVRMLLAESPLQEDRIEQYFQVPPERISAILKELQKDGLVREEKGCYLIVPDIDLT